MPQTPRYLSTDPTAGDPLDQPDGYLSTDPTAGEPIPVRGPRVAGNIDLFNQPKVKNPDGSTSTVDSRSYNLDGREVLLPSVTPDGRHLQSDADIINEYKRTGRHLGIFDTPEDADAYAQQLHEDYAAGKYRHPVLKADGQFTGPATVTTPPLPETAGKQRSRTGQLYTTPPIGTMPVLDAPYTGAKQIAQGAGELFEAATDTTPPPTSNEPLRRSRTGALYQPPPSIDPRTYAGAADIAEGAMQMAEPIVAGVALAAPVHTAITLAAATGAAKGTEAAMLEAGATPEQARLAADVVGGMAAGLPIAETLRTGVIDTGRAARRAGDAAAASRQAAAEAARTITPEPTDIVVQPERTKLPAPVEYVSTDPTAGEPISTQADPVQPVSTRSEPSQPVSPTVAEPEVESPGSTPPSHIPEGEAASVTQVLPEPAPADNNPVTTGKESAGESLSAHSDDELRKEFRVWDINTPADGDGALHDRQRMGAINAELERRGLTPERRSTFGSQTKKPRATPPPIRPDGTEEPRAPINWESQPAVDTLDTGEAQPRLPEAGAVRDANVKTPEIDAPFSLAGEVDQGTRGAQTGLRFDQPGEQAQTTAGESSGSEADGEVEGRRETDRESLAGVAESVATRPETPRQTEARRTRHYTDAFGHILERARQIDPAVDETALRHEFQTRVDMVDAAKAEARANTTNLTDVLRTIAKYGGLSDHGPYGGEVRRLNDGKDAFGGLGGVPKVFQQRYLRGAHGQVVAGHSLSEMVERLHEDYPDIENEGDLLAVLDDAHVATRADRYGPVFPGTRELAQQSSMDPKAAWWTVNPMHVTEQPEAAAPPSEDSDEGLDAADTSFNPQELEAPVSRDTTPKKSAAEMTDEELAAEIMAEVEAEQSPSKERPRVIPVPKGWTLAVGRTRTKEGHTFEAEVDWRGKRIVFADQRHMDNPEIRNHEIGHVLVEMVLPEAERKALFDDYIAHLKIDEWEVKNHFHRERIAIDLTPYLTYGKAEHGLQPIFDKYIGPLIEAEQPPAKPVKLRTIVVNRRDGTVEERTSEEPAGPPSTLPSEAQIDRQIREAEKAGRPLRSILPENASPGLARRIIRVAGELQDKASNRLAQMRRGTSYPENHPERVSLELRYNELDRLIDAAHTLLEGYRARAAGTEAPKAEPTPEPESSTSDKSSTDEKKSTGESSDEARKAENKRKRDELFAKLRNKLTSLVDPEDVVTMVKILRTYVDDGIIEGRKAWREFKTDAPDLAAKLVRHFEVAWEKLRGEKVNVATFDELAPEPKLHQESADSKLPTGKPLKFSTLHAVYWDLARKKLTEWPTDARTARELAQQLVGHGVNDEVDEVTDGIEGALNVHLRREITGRDDTAADWIMGGVAIEKYMPRGWRSLEKLDLQQFSTPLPIAAAAQWLADAAASQGANGRILEPTAGTGNLLSLLGGGRVTAVELAPRRAEVLRLAGAEVREGDYLHLLDLKGQFDVIVTNPPWGKYGTGKYGQGIALGFSPMDVAERFIAKNVRDLKDGGRLVAIMPTTMLRSPSFRHFLGKQGTLRAVIQSPPEAYRTRSTDVDSLLLVWDKVHLPAAEYRESQEFRDRQPVMATGEQAPKAWAEYASLVARIPAREVTEGRRDDRPTVDPVAPAPAPVRGPSDGGGSGRPEPVGDADVTAPSVRSTRPAPVVPSESQPAGPAPRLAREDGRDATRGLSADQRLAYEHAAASQHFAPYRLRTDLVGQRHPKLVVEARGLSGVPYPELTVTPTAKVAAIVKAGRASVEQAEQAMALVQANINGHHGFLAADNVGVGKSREIGLAIIDLMDRATAAGRELRLMVTTKNEDTISGLIDDELTGALLQGKEPDFDIVKVTSFKNATEQKLKKGQFQPLPRHPHAIYVVDSYNLARFRTALLKVGLHGVIGDEVHNYKNAGASVGATWQSIHGQIMLTVPRDQQAFGYFTATPAQSVYDYRYLYGLREWPLDGFDDWVLRITGRLDDKKTTAFDNAVKQGANNPTAILDNTKDTPIEVGGDSEDAKKRKQKFAFREGGESIFNQLLSPAEAEQIPRELKVKGKFSSRDLWREGTDFDTLERPLSPAFKATYDKFAALARDIYDAVDFFGKMDKSGARSMFGPGSALQNAAKRIQMQPALEEAITVAKEYVASGHQVVLSVINVNEMDPESGNIGAAIEMINRREVDKTDDGMLIDKGDIPEALIRRAELLEQAKAIGSFPNPLDMVNEAFGPENVVLVVGENNERQTEVDEFQAGKRQVAVISAAGSTGINLDHRIKTGKGAGGRRVFIDVQYEWSATSAVQRYGRVDRSSSITPPIIRALNFGSATEKKFLATVANRMSSLGALSKGGAESTGANALEDFEITGDDSLNGARIAWGKLSEADKQLWRGSVFWDRRNPENVIPLTETKADMRQIQLALLWLPIDKANTFWESFIAERDELREAMGYTNERRAKRYTGDILRTIELPGDRLIAQVKNANGERFGVLQGPVMADMPSLRKIVPDYLKSRPYATFTATDGRVVAGLVLPWMRVKAIARYYGKSVEGVQLKTVKDVQDALAAGERVAVQAPGGEEWTLYQRKDSRIAIDGAKMAHRQFLQTYGAGYNAVGNWWGVTDLERFLERFPVKQQTAEIDATDEAPDEPSPSRGGGGGGSTVQSAVVPGAAEFVEQDVAPALREAGHQMRRAIGDLRVVFAPDTVSPASEFSAGAFRANMAARDQRIQRAQKAMRAAEKAMDHVIGAAERGNQAAIDRFLAFTDVMEGLAEPSTLPQAQQEIARQIRDLLKKTRIEVQKRGKLQQFIEHYMPHEWADPSAAENAMRRLFGKRPLQGPRHFLKKRSIDTTRFGVEEAELIPVTWNPVTLALRKLVEMEKWIAAHDLLQKDLKRMGTAKFFSVGSKPEGEQSHWVRFPDSFGTVYGPPVVKVKEAYDPDLMEVLEELAANLNTPTSRKAKIGGRRWGYYQQLEGIVTKFAGPETVLMHEIGHAIDERFDLQGRLGTSAHPFSKASRENPITQELRDLADLRAEEGETTESFKKYLRKGEEKVANLVHAFIYNPALAKKVAPNAYAKLASLAKQHDILKPLLTAQQTRSLKLGVNQTEIPVGGALITGSYYGPPEVVRLVSNYLSPGLTGKSALFDAYRKAGNFMNQLQLGISAFHMMMTGMESVASKQSAMLEALTRGRFLDALKFQVQVPGAPLIDLYRGHQALKDFYAHDANAQSVRTMVDQVVQGGGGFGWSLFEHTDALRDVGEAVRRGNYPGALLRAFPAAIQAPTKFIMDFWVPRLKMAAFLDRARLELPTLGERPDLDQTRVTLGRAWDSIDNRFGELRYDNLFWHNTLKHLLMASVRAVGWNTGSIREAMGAPSAQLKRLGVLPEPGAGGRGGIGKRPTRRVHTGDDEHGRPIYEDVPEPLLDPKFAWVLATIIVYGMAGAVLMYLMTGKRPESAKDLFFPRTGRKNPDGTDERVSIAGYPKDWYAFAQHPVATATHKLHPLLTEIADVLTNEDFYGTEIRNPKDPMVEQAKDVGAFVIEQFAPFSLVNFARDGDINNFFGITPAPASVNRSDAENVMHEILASRGHMTTTQEQAERRDLRRDLRNRLITPRDARESGKLTGAQVRRTVRDSRLSYVQRGFKSLTITEALDVYDEATPAERAQLYGELRQKARNMQVPPSEKGAVLRRIAAATKLQRTQGAAAAR